MAAARSWWIRSLALGFLGLFLWGAVSHGGHRHDSSHAAGLQSVCTLCQAHDNQLPISISQGPALQNLPGYQEAFQSFCLAKISSPLTFRGCIRAPPYSA